MLHGFPPSYPRLTLSRYASSFSLSCVSFVCTSRRRWCVRRRPSSGIPRVARLLREFLGGRTRGGDHRPPSPFPLGCSLETALRAATVPPDKKPKRDPISQYPSSSRRRHPRRFSSFSSPRAISTSSGGIRGFNPRFLDARCSRDPFYLLSFSVVF